MGTETPKEGKTVKAEDMFIQTPANYNGYNEIDDSASNEALTMDFEGKIQYRKNNFDKSSAYSSSLLQYRNDNSSGFYERKGATNETTPEGYVTINGNFKYNDGNKYNDTDKIMEPITHDDKDTSFKNRVIGIYKIGNLNVNSLRSLNNEDQNV